MQRIYPVIGYGSLMHPDSMSKTLTPREFKPVKVEGYKRIYNLVTRRDWATTVLNVEPSEVHDFNGVLFSVYEDEMEKLLERESSYDPEWVKVFDFETGEEICHAITFVGFHPHIDLSHRGPHNEYFDMCREAAYKISWEFGKYFDDTTHLCTGDKISEIL